MAMCDVFVVADDVQFERQGFRNRNRVKLANGIKWLTVPVEHVGKDLKIKEVHIANEAEPKWAERHWLTLRQYYGGAPFWKEFSGFFEESYKKEWDLLIDLNMHLIMGVMGFLGIEKRLVMSSSLSAGGKKSELVLNQCKELGCDVHLAGAGEREYLDLASFKNAGVKVVFQEFRYPVYEQLHGAFVPDLSVVDYLFCAGAKPWRNQDGSLKETVQ